MTKQLELATLGGGCFWCLEAIYQDVRGVERSVSGYAGGRTNNPTYDQVHHSDTGHAEVVQLSFDPNVVSYRQLLEIFFYIHNPTTPNQQGHDIGPEYRSIILYHSDNQKTVANEISTSFAPTLWTDPIITEIVPLAKFWPAEPEHQNFFMRNPQMAYCQVIINPKLSQFRRRFENLLKS